MDMQSVNSSNLSAVGYDPTTQTLRIAFHSGIYDYFNVPSNIYTNLMNAVSKGEYHHQYIKHSYTFKKIG